MDTAHVGHVAIFMTVLGFISEELEGHNAQYSVVLVDGG